MSRLSLPPKNLTAAGISALIVVVLFVSLGAKPSMQSTPKYEYKVLSQTKLNFEAHQDQGRQIYEAAMQAQQQAPQNEKQFKQVADMYVSQISSIVLDGPTKEIEDALNKLGSEGWELVGITEALCILKRPIK